MLLISQDEMERLGIYLCSELSLTSRNYPGEVNSPLKISKPASGLMVLVKLFNRVYRYVDVSCVFGVIANNVS